MPRCVRGNWRPRFNLAYIGIVAIAWSAIVRGDRKPISVWMVASQFSITTRKLRRATPRIANSTVAP